MWQVMLATISWGSGRNQRRPLISFPYTFSPFLTITLQRCPSAEGDTEAKATQVTELEAIPQKTNQGQWCPSHAPSHRRSDRRPVSKETQAPASRPSHISKIRFHIYLSNFYEWGLRWTSQGRREEKKTGIYLRLTSQLEAEWEEATLFKSCSTWRCFLNKIVMVTVSGLNEPLTMTSHEFTISHTFFFLPHLFAFLS